MLHQRRSRTIASLDDLAVTKRKQKPLKAADNMKVMGKRKEEGLDRRAREAGMGGGRCEGEWRGGEERVVSVVQQNTCLDGLCAIGHTATQCLCTQVALFNVDHLNF